MPGPGRVTAGSTRVRYYATIAEDILAAAFVKKLRDTYAGALVGNAVFGVPDIVGSGKFFPTDAGETPTLLAGAEWLRAVAVVPSFGTEVGSSSIPLFGEPALNVPGSPTLSPITFTFYPDQAVAAEAKWVSNVPGIGVRDGTTMMMIVRFQGDVAANKSYIVALGQVSGLSIEPTADGAVSFTRSLTPDSMLANLTISA